MKPSQNYFSVRRATLLALLICTTPTMADDAMSNQAFMNTKDIKWENAPPTLPKGAKVAVLFGDPGKEGPFVMRLMAPAGYKIPPHWHSQNENLTVISGTLYLGLGDKMDTAQAHGLAAGGFHYLPGKAHHYAFAKTPTIVQVHGQGPFDITYINPEDDPQRMAGK